MATALYVPKQGRQLDAHSAPIELPTHARVVGMEQDYVQCPSCEYTAPLNDFGDLGADEDKVWCNNCHKQITPIRVDTREKIDRELSR